MRTFSTYLLNVFAFRSKKRKLKADISTAFPSLSAEELSELVPNKEELNVVKIYAHKGDAVTLYVLHKNPVFFELKKRVYPTVYTLWRYPHVLPAFTTWPPVLQKLDGGADLMLPGVVVPPSGFIFLLTMLWLFVARVPVAVGTATMSNAEMQGLGMKCRGVSIFHTYMDSLWKFGDKAGPPSIPDVDTEGDDEQATEGGEEEPCPNPEDPRSPQGSSVGCLFTRTCPQFIDALLRQCFLHSLKNKVKKSELPLLTSTFLHIHMFSCCQSGKQLDIKKSSYIKVTTFLQNMQQQHILVRVKKLSKGVDWKNPDEEFYYCLLCCIFHTPEDPGTEEAPMEVGGGEGEKLYHPLEITTLYRVSSSGCSQRKGTVLQPAEVRTIVTDYVKRNELKSDYQEMEALVGRPLQTLDKMQHCHQLVFPGQPPIVKKGHIEPIDISVASRSSNKKVTMIKNLEVYGLDPTAVSVALQHSSALNSVPGSKDRVLVQIQGNRVQQVGFSPLYFADKYQIPRKYIQGLDKVQKPGKNK
uniref:Eukaryotic translation initiation factor 2D n=1 Tax=Hucho hucho TaxID=62062 RepID=A0A4W5K0E9_9TELE